MSYKYADDLDSIKYYDTLPAFDDNVYKYLYSSEIGFNENSCIADIGSGTGRLTLPLLEKGSLVYAVDPDANMRMVCEEKCNKFGSRFKSINGNDINTNISSSSIDFVLVSQAFHKFNIDEFKKECKRILKNSNNVIIIWYRIDFCRDIYKDMLESLKSNFLEYKSRYEVDEIEGALLEEQANNLSVYKFFSTNTKLKTINSVAKLRKNDFIRLGMSLSLFPISHKYNSVSKIFQLESFDLENYKSDLNNIFERYSLDGFVSLEFKVQIHSYCKND